MAQIKIIDALDRKILRALQRDSEEPIADLAARLGLSRSACSRRIARLAEIGIIERSVALSNGGLIMPLDLPEKLIDTGRAPMALTQEEFPDDGVNLDGMLGEVEKRWLLAALEEAQGNKTEAAGLLQMSFRSFRYRLAKLGMEDISTT